MTTFERKLMLGLMSVLPEVDQHGVRVYVYRVFNDARREGAIGGAELNYLSGFFAALTITRVISEQAFDAAGKMVEEYETSAGCAR